MAKKALYQKTERLIAIATDIFHIGNSNKDYRITLANLSQQMTQYLESTYFLRPAALNISEGPQVTNLSVYEAGGASEKPNGFKIKVSWTGGNKTYSHLFTGTTYTIGGLTIANWAGYGTGSLTLQLDKTNGNWNILTDGIFDKFVSTGNQKVFRWVDGKQEIHGPQVSWGGGATQYIYAVTFANAFLAGTVPMVRVISSGTTNWVSDICNSITATTANIGVKDTSSIPASNYGFYAIGQWR